MANQNVKPAQGKLGVLVVGNGAVATTFMTGVLMARKGLAKPVGSMTQYDKIRIGKGAEKKYMHYGEIVPMADLNDIVFGTWDVYPANAFEAAVNADVLKAKDIIPVEDELKAIVPMKAAFDKNFAKRLDGTHVKECKDRWDSSCARISAHSSLPMTVSASLSSGQPRQRFMCLSIWRFMILLSILRLP